MKTLVIMALLIALNVVFVRFLSFQTLTIRFDLGFLTLALAAIMFGPIGGGVVGIISDIVGMLIFSKGLPYFPLFTVNAFLYGCCYGFFLGRGKRTMKNILICIALETIVINVCLTTVWLFLYNKLILQSEVAFFVVLTNRLFALILIVPLHVLGLWLLSKQIYPRLMKAINIDKRKKFASYINSEKLDINLGLQRVKRLLELCGNPQSNLKFVHVAGTNGKGSVCSFLQSVLSQSGYKTGKFVSPFIKEANEVISIDGQSIDVKIYDKMLDEFQEYCDIIYNETNEKPTQFEVLTALSILYFYRKECDIVVLEVGMGGLLDATNVISSPLACVITQIDVDHKDYLGNTIEEIAKQKAGIIKPNTCVVTCNENEKVLDVIKQIAIEQKAELILSERGIEKYHQECNEIIDYKGIKSIYIGIPGYYQIQNASLAIETLLVLKDKCGLNNITVDSILQGVRTAKNLGRFEILSSSPIILFDGAHNQNGAIALNESLQRYFEGKKIAFVIGFMKDKEIKECLKELKGDYYFYVNAHGTPRALPAEMLMQVGEAVNIYGEAVSDVNLAIEKAKSVVDVVVVCGSLYLYKEIFVESATLL